MCARITSSKEYELLYIYEILRPSLCLRIRAYIYKLLVYPTSPITILCVYAMCPVRRDEYNFLVSRICLQIYCQRLRALLCLDLQRPLILSPILKLNIGSRSSIVPFDI